MSSHISSLAKVLVSRASPRLELFADLIGVDGLCWHFKRNQVASQVVHASPYASLCTLSRKCGNFNGVGWSLKRNLFTSVFCNPPPFQSLFSLSFGWVETGVLPGARLQHKGLKREADNHLKIFGNHIKQPSPNFGTHDPRPQQVVWGLWKGRIHLHHLSS